MSAPELAMCAYCNGLIEDDAVPVAEEPGASGPGWTLYAHREHAHLYKPDPRPAQILARVQARRRRK